MGLPPLAEQPTHITPTAGSKAEPAAHYPGGHKKNDPVGINAGRAVQGRYCESRFCASAVIRTWAAVEQRQQVLNTRRGKITGILKRLNTSDLHDQGGHVAAPRAVVFSAS